MEVKVKIINKEIPTQILSYAKHGDSGIDLIATSKTFDEYGNVVFGTNLAFEIPYGYVGLLFPRSSNAKKDLLNTNSVGVIDSGYRGEVMMKYKHSLNTAKILEFNTRVSSKVFSLKEGVKNDYEDLTENPFDSYEIGDRIGQIIILPYPQIEFVVSDELSETERGSGSYGSTGR